MKKLLLLFALLIFACSSDSEGNPCIYEPTLSTEAVTDITETSATLNGVISILSENCDIALGGMQGFVYSTNPSPTNDDNVEVVYGTDISTTIDNLLPNTTYYVRVFITNSLGEFYGNEMEFTTEDNGGEPADCDVVYLDSNGITIKACESANIGDVGTINGVEYTVVDREMLEQMLLNDEDVTKVCTTRITDMSFLIAYWGGNELFNQDIGNWDVSNVTDMSGMFDSAQYFNQPIGNWDVSNVTDMGYMFNFAYSFNQEIGNWDVSNVTNMGYMFSSFQTDDFTTSFNQDIGNWDVSNVVNMQFMFDGNESFNQDISDWDVSNVNNMRYMFSQNSPFNHDIGNWDVSNVTDMFNMFWNNSVFNQPIGDWNVSSVTNMGSMFRDAASFNQPIGDWDVSNVSYMASMFYEADTFNQDISDWDVDNVLDCNGFSDNTPQWTLPQPNFTNCNPN